MTRTSQELLGACPRLGRTGVIRARANKPRFLHFQGHLGDLGPTAECRRRRASKTPACARTAPGETAFLVAEQFGFDEPPGGIAPQLMARKGLAAARACIRESNRAASSLPEPLFTRQQHAGFGGTHPARSWRSERSRAPGRAQHRRALHLDGARPRTASVRFGEVTIDRLA